MNNNVQNNTLLLILDGWGVAPSWGGNAVSVARTPNFDKIWRTYPHSTLCSSGECVGLPGHERGNSEVGHLNIGSGRIVMQDSSLISHAISDGSFYNNQILIDAISHAKKNNSNLHLMGLASKGGIHSNINHLYALLELCQKNNFDNNRVFIHAFTDGRDSDPMAAISDITHLEDKINSMKVGKIATISGRYYAMDRDNHWERTQRVYDAMTEGIGIENSSPLKAISESYNRGVTDEFMIPTVIVKDNNPQAKVKDNDSIIFFNFRSDRARQIAMAFMADNIKSFRRKKKINNLYFVGMIPYGYEKELRINVKSAFYEGNVQVPFAEVLSSNNLKQYHSAETEKYAHVTYFFNGGREDPYPMEERLLVPSPKVPTYDMKPEMSIKEVNSNAIKKIKSKKYPFMLVNFANADMVGHTGNFKAALMACEYIDEELGKTVKAVLDAKGVIIVTADHGNIEQMVNPKTGEPDTEHSRNPVPMILVGDQTTSLKDINLRLTGKLADITPTISELLNINKSEKMTGQSMLTRI